MAAAMSTIVTQRMPRAAAGWRAAAKPSHSIVVVRCTCVDARIARLSLARPQQQQRRHVFRQPLHSASSSSQGSGTRTIVTAAAAAAAIAGPAASAATALPALPALLQAAGVFVLCCAAAALLVAAIPAVLAAARAAHRAEAVLKLIEQELPDTAASLRLSGLELGDALAELGALGGDVTGGLRASARMVAAAEAGLRAAPGVVTGTVVPALARTETHARGKLEGLLLERASPDATPDLLPAVARGAALAARRGAELSAVPAAGLASLAFSAGSALRGIVEARALRIARASAAASAAASSVDE